MINQQLTIVSAKNLKLKSIASHSRNVIWNSALDSECRSEKYFSLNLFKASVQIRFKATECEVENTCLSSIESQPRIQSAIF